MTLPRISRLLVLWLFLYHPNSNLGTFSCLERCYALHRELVLSSDLIEYGALFGETWKTGIKATAAHSIQGDS